mmetsp:Transcript_30432/g.85837  ORF Transcript_30432/g.85837 Transcript_30432/m.85837 type:complete len:439 (-) Transcript_30432:798-2114(-)
MRAGAADAGPPRRQGRRPRRGVPRGRYDGFKYLAKSDFGPVVQISFVAQVMLVTKVRYVAEAKKHHRQRGVRPGPAERRPRRHLQRAYPGAEDPHGHTALPGRDGEEAHAHGVRLHQRRPHRGCVRLLRHVGWQDPRQEDVQGRPPQARRGRGGRGRERLGGGVLRGGLRHVVLRRVLWVASAGRGLDGDLHQHQLQQQQQRRRSGAGSRGDGLREADDRPGAGDEVGRRRGQAHRPPDPRLRAHEHAHGRQEAAQRGEEKVPRDAEHPAPGAAGRRSDGGAVQDHRPAREGQPRHGRLGDDRLAGEPLRPRLRRQLPPLREGGGEGAGGAVDARRGVGALPGLRRHPRAAPGPAAALRCLRFALARGRTGLRLQRGLRRPREAPARGDRHPPRPEGAPARQDLARPRQPRGPLHEREVRVQGSLHQALPAQVRAHDL